MLNTGLDDNVTEEILFAAFIPFGDIKEVTVPKDFTVNKHKGFGFVEYEESDDAKAAIDNMDGAELFGKVIRCNFAKPLTKVSSGKAVWSSEEWIQNNLNEGELIDNDEEMDVNKELE